MPEMKSTQALQDVIADAKMHAEQRGHDYLGPAHILLAMITSTRAPSAQHILTQLGADLPAIEATIEQLLQPAAPPWGTTRSRSGVRPHKTELPYTSRAAAALQHAIALATDHGAPAMGTGHMLLGLLHDPRSPAAVALHHHAITHDKALPHLTTDQEPEP